MTMTFDEDKPSLEEIGHSGVKGMKWGVRKKVSGREIRSARARLGAEQDKLFTKEREVRKTGKGNAAYQKQKTAFLNNPDRVLATRLTKGEKATQLILLGPLGALTIGGMTAYSNSIAKKQATGAYKRK